MLIACSVVDCFFNLRFSVALLFGRCVFFLFFFSFTSSFFHSFVPITTDAKNILMYWNEEKWQRSVKNNNCIFFLYQKGINYLENHVSRHIHKHIPDREEDNSTTTTTTTKWREKLCAKWTNNCSGTLIKKSTGRWTSPRKKNK